MSISILRSKDSTKIEKVKKEFDVFRVITMKKGNLNSIEFFNKDGAFRGFGRDFKTAYRKAKKTLKNYYN
ncbi:hypothetical protein CP965_09020 [Halarcobacter mediterraneus]|uniref:Uncharacterized protein n=1 Tax=Halarcobacter mediterraneus TaxID=2023153 RepID=A0A4Q1B3U0_9BACT|nr:hypothetical protein [Halarcobacter mediterraneus]RXK12708.1 hypothetical protein CP965_09020 [Halarcobacter mediterraneus]